MNSKYMIGENVNVHIINNNELETVLNFQKEIIDNMPNKDWFVPLTKEEFLTPINGRDNAYFFIHNQQIIGLFVLTCDIPDILKEYKLLEV